MSNNQESHFLCKQFDFLLYLLSFLLILSTFYVIFGWGVTPKQVENEIEREVAALTGQGGGAGAKVTPNNRAMMGREFEPPENTGVMPGPAAGVKPAFFGLTEKSIIGLDVYAIDFWNKERLGLRNNEGVIVSSVGKNSMAAQAGIQVDDVIFSIGNKTIEDTTDYNKQIDRMVNGLRYRIRFYRAGKRRKVYLDFKTSTPTNMQQVAQQGIAPATTIGLSWLGADVQDIDPMLQKHFGLPNTRGAIVSHVEKGSPAAIAKFKRGDVIKEFGPKKIIDVIDMQKMIKQSQPGQKVRLSILRQGQIIHPSVVLDKKPAAAQVQPSFLPGATIEVEASWLGMDIAPLTSKRAKNLHIPVGTHGILVGSVKAGLGQKAGMKMGDVIVGVNKTKIINLATLKAAAADAKGAVIEVIRGGKHLYISVEPPTPFKQNNVGNSLRQVAGTTWRLVAIAAGGQTLFDQVYPDFASAPFILIYNPNNGSSELINNTPKLSLPQMSTQLMEKNIAAIITGNMASDLQTLYYAENIDIFAGVFGNIYNAIRMYKNHQLTRTAIKL